MVGVIGLASLGVVVASPAPAWACDCGGVSDAEAFERADAVFVAEVEQDDDVAPRSQMVEPSRERWVFEVSEVFKGEVAERQVAVSNPNGGSCGLELWREGPYLVFASRESDFISQVDPGPGELYVHLCQGTRSLGANAAPASFGAPAPPLAVEPEPASSSDLPGVAVIILGVAAAAVAAGVIVLVVSRQRRSS